MSDIAIRAEGLSKQYHIGGAQKTYYTLRDQLTDVLMSPFRRAGKLLHGQATGAAELDETIWALKNVSFEIKRGEVVGIIGRNGAGKSTLLKIFSRITEPTEGYADIYGRVSSLLEVGTGFHPELTGRENVYLNGAILGMRKAEIEHKFDEIVAFAEIDKFIDTPVKHYSSGMYVRLAFAVAAHLEPEVLLVDEVLAVGDIGFQKKCLGKMGDVAREGRTVLFVSHNLSAVANLCTRAYLLEQGQVTLSSDPQSVIETYVRSLQHLIGNRMFDQIEDREGNGQLKFVDLKIRDSQGQLTDTVTSGQNVTFELVYEADESIRSKSVVTSIAFYSLLGRPLFNCRSNLQGTIYEQVPARGSVFCNIPKLPLPPGEFRVNIHCEVNGVRADWIRDARMLTVLEGDFYGSGRLPGRKRGDLLVEHYWLPPVEAEKREQ